MGSNPAKRTTFSSLWRFVLSPCDCSPKVFILCKFICGREIFMTDVVAKNLQDMANQRKFADGSKRTVAVLASAAVGRGEYLPGWKWSEHAGPQTGKNSEAHIGYILIGQMVVRGADGQEVLVGPGDSFEAQPGHDAWVVGDETCIALDFEHLGKGPQD